MSKNLNFKRVFTKNILSMKKLDFMQILTPENWVNWKCNYKSWISFKESTRKFLNLEIQMAQQRPKFPITFSLNYRSFIIHKIKHTWCKFCSRCINSSFFCCRCLSSSIILSAWASTWSAKTLAYCKIN